MRGKLLLALFCSLNGFNAEHEVMTTVLSNKREMIILHRKVE